MGNIHFTEILDWFLGWFGWDVSGDDKATALRKQQAAADEAARELGQPPARTPPPDLAPPRERRGPSEAVPKPSREPAPRPGKRRIEDLIP